MDQKPTWEFTCKYWEDHPGAPPEEIEKAYQEHLKTQADTQPERRRSGGLGGTILFGDELGDGYEGVDLKRETVCQREPTTSRLLQCLLDKRVIVVRSPPMAGKTTLAQLFEQHLLQSDEVKRGSRRVFRISLLWMERQGSPWTFAERFQWLMDGTRWADFLDESNNLETVLIVDEVQKIYKPEGESEPLHGGNVFWNTFKNIRQYSKLRIVAFASYGYLGAYSNSGESGKPMEISPYHLDKGNIWDFKDVRFTVEEFNDYFERFCRNKLKMSSEEDTQWLSRYVHKATARHPGLVAFVMDRIYERFLKHSPETLTFVKVFTYIKSYDFQAGLKRLRAAPRLNSMTDDEKQLADSVLFKGGITLRSDVIPCYGRLLKTNVLTDISSAEVDGITTLDFPAPLLRAIYLQDRLGAGPRPEVGPKTFKEFIILVFGAMNSKTLQMNLGVGKDGRLLERVWQMEFYRAAMQILPADIYASVDVGVIFGSDGYLDFYVDDNRNWAIELLRDGERTKEHENRFYDDGRYSTILEIAKEWAIVDIRQSRSMPKNIKPNFIYVLCSDSFDYVVLKFADGKEQHVKLLGEAHLLG